MGQKNILLLTGGNSQEHEVTLRSTKLMSEALNSWNDFKVYTVKIEKSGNWTYQDEDCFFTTSGHLHCQNMIIKIDYGIPYIHGHLGETGHLASLFEISGTPYLGPNPETSVLTFNKVVTKLICDKLQIPNTPYFFLANNSKPSIEKAEIFLKEYQTIFVKASNQGSSVGCYKVAKEEDLKIAIENAFQLSPYVLLESAMDVRELEVSAFHYQGRTHITRPGEIKSFGFYDYEEKYGESSKAELYTEAKDLSENALSKIEKFSQKIFESLKTQDLSRIDFFLVGDDQVFLNEINTYPGLTEISMFPRMMENYGVSFRDYIKDRVDSSTK